MFLLLERRLDVMKFQHKKFFMSIFLLCRDIVKMFFYIYFRHKCKGRKNVNITSMLVRKNLRILSFKKSVKLLFNIDIMGNQPVLVIKHPSRDGKFQITHRADQKMSKGSTDPRQRDVMAWHVNLDGERKREGSREQKHCVHSSGVCVW